MNILFVDDYVMVLDGLRRMLRSMSGKWRMHFVTSANEALALLGKGHFDMIVTDVQMREVSGIELLKRVRDMFPHVIRFVLSGCCREQTFNQAAAVAHQVIAKPCDTEKLKNLISRAFVLNKRIHKSRSGPIVSSIQSLPSMPRIYEEVVEVLRDSDRSARKVGQLIANDIGMSAKILQVANTSFCGARARIADPVRAVVHLGLETVGALILSEGIFSKLSEERVREFYLDGLQEHSIRVGRMARQICKMQHMSEESLEVAMMAGILHESGMIILASDFADQLREMIAESRRRRVPLYKIETDRLAVNHADVSGMLLDFWQLPQGIVEAVTFHHEPHLCPVQDFSVVAAVYAANAIDHELCSGLGDGYWEGVNMSYLQELGLEERWFQWRERLLKNREHLHVA